MKTDRQINIEELQSFFEKNCKGHMFIMFWNRNSPLGSPKEETPVCLTDIVISCGGIPGKELYVASVKYYNITTNDCGNYHLRMTLSKKSAIKTFKKTLATRFIEL